MPTRWASTFPFAILTACFTLHFLAPHFLSGDLKFFSRRLKVFSGDLVISYRRPKFLSGCLVISYRRLVISYRQSTFLSDDLKFFSSNRVISYRQLKFLSGDLDLQSRLSNHRFHQDAIIRELLVSRVRSRFLLTRAWRCADFASCIHAAPTTRRSATSKRCGQTMPVAHHAARHTHMRIKK